MSRTGGLFGSLSLADVPGLEQIRGKLFKQQASSRRRFQQNDNDDDPATLEMKQRNMLHTQVALGTLAFSSIMTLLVLFVLEVTTFTHVAFYFPLVLAPVAALQRWRIHFFSGKYVLIEYLFFVCMYSRQNSNKIFLYFLLM